MYWLDKCASRRAKKPVTFLVINAVVIVLRINKKAAKMERVITISSNFRARSPGKVRIKLSEFGIGTSEMILSPSEVTAAIRSKPKRSKIEMRNCVSPRRIIFLLSDFGKRSNTSFK